MARHRKRHTRDRGLNKRVRKLLKNSDLTRISRRVYRYKWGSGVGRSDYRER